MSQTLGDLIQRLDQLTDDLDIALANAVCDETAALQDLLTCTDDTDSGDRDHLAVTLNVRKLDVIRLTMLRGRLG
jgi:hypothetical protein